MYAVSEPPSKWALLVPLIGFGATYKGLLYLAFRLIRKNEAMTRNLWKSN